MQVRERCPLKLGLYLPTENGNDSSLLEYLLFKEPTLWSLRRQFWVVGRLTSQRRQRNDLERFLK